MRKTPTIGMTLVVLALAFVSYLRAPVEGQAPPTGIAAIPSEKGGRMSSAPTTWRSGRSR
jgi:hypothetical protein